MNQALVAVVLLASVSSSGAGPNLFLHQHPPITVGDSSSMIAAIKKNVQKRGGSVDSALVVTDSFATVLVRASSTSHRRIESFQRTGSEIRDVGDAIDVDEFGVVPFVSWFSVGQGRINTLLYRFDGAVEGVAQSRVYSEVGGRWSLTYKDPPMICTPAALRNIGGREVLVRYTNVMSSQDCDAPCDIYVRETVGVEPAWVELFVWDKSKWRMPGSPDREFYRHLAGEYRRAANQVQGKGTKMCGTQASAMVKLLERFAQRAASYSTP